MKAATLATATIAATGSISIHAAREGGDSGKGIVEWDAVISIHAAREGGDAQTALQLKHCILFQSTPPVKAATHRPLVYAAEDVEISIHAAREGGDVYLV